MVVNPAAKNALGQPTGYALIPGENAVPFSLPDSWIRKRAGFLNAHLWVTPYRDDERYPAGDYPYRIHAAAPACRNGPPPTAPSTTATWCCGTRSASPTIRARKTGR